MSTFPPSPITGRRGPGSRRRRRGALGASLALGLLLLSPALAGPAPTPAATGEAVAEAREEWYRVEIAGRPAGWAMTREDRQGDEITTRTELEVSFKRADTEVTVGIATRFVETSGGEPVSMWVRQSLGRVPVETHYTFAEDGLRVRSVQGESVSETSQPSPAGDWLPPAAARRRMEAQIAAGGDRYGYRTLDPATGPLPVDVVGRRMGEGHEVRLPGGSTVPTSRWSQFQEPGPGVETTLYLDPSGRIVKSVTPMMGAELVLRLAGREEARGALREAPELLVRTFVRPNRPIRAPRSTRRAVYVLRSSRGELPELPSAGGQRVERRGEGVRVVVSADGLERPAAKDDDSGDGGDAARYLEASAFINHRDPAVAALARRALEEAGLAEAEGAVGADGDAARARALRDFVHRYLEAKDLGTGFATASEVAALASSDCTEHSVLLAALLRAAGIPSRAVVGLLYVERFAGARELFGYHMWTQGLVGGRWVDYDALTPDRFDAAHIALATSSLSDGEGIATAAAAVASLVGALEIEVVEVER